MNKKSIIYCDIESLLDLRQGALALKGIDNLTVYEYLKSDTFTMRQTDHLKFLEQGEYQALVDAGDRGLLLNATVTYNLTVLLSRVAATTSLNAVNGETAVPEIWLNIYPFEMSPEETGMIRDGLFSKMDDDCFIQIVSISPEELTPTYLAQMKPQSALIYNYRRWLNIHGDALTKINLTDTKFFFPKIYEVELEEEDLEGKAELDEFGGAFELLKVALGVVMDISYLPTLFYSNITIALANINEYHDSLLKETESAMDRSGISEEVIDEYVDEHLRDIG